MTNIFFGLSGGLGPLMRNAPTAERFIQSGASVYMSIYGESSMAWVERLGYKLLVDDDPTMPDPDKLIPPQPAIYDLDHYYAQMGLLDERFAEAWIRQRIRMLESIGADLVIADMSPHTLIAAKVLGIPSVSITQSCFHPDGKPLYFWGTPPRNLPKVTPVMNRLLHTFGLPAVERMEELFRADVDIVPGIPEMDRIYNNRVRYVGPISMNMPVSVGTEPEKNFRRPAVLVYPGRLTDSAGDSGMYLVKAVLTAFAETPVFVVIATSEALPEAWLAGLPSNIRIVPFVEEERVGEFDLFIHHGGHGSCMSSIARGVPSLIIPTHTEREFNARHLHELGIGEYMMPRSFSPSHLYDLSKYIMQDEYRDHAGDLQKLLEKRGYQGALSVFECAQQLLRGTNRSTAR
ncbi:glycosyltransferase [Paenibacillus oleatilyticus]|uniref:Glycosyltransferase n=1 Tax=Paenibacillus oleatilyticus TaxID=2594886 RepID=A0ABV4UX53_9BACL|nr:nucleotide disphospho-sugar-binding domain-containing protein [Paenibacillus oleatilyticus]MBU7316756.1 hypothetical protein [Paenibacillus oleatilyticus]